METKGPNRRLAAIMFTDIVGYTALMGKDEAQTLEMVNRMRATQSRIIAEHDGVVVKELGDGMLAYFNMAKSAVNCAVAIQRSLSKTFEVKVRIGIHKAEVIFENNDIFGDGVNVASRIEPLADPGGIYLSESVIEDLTEPELIITQLLGTAKLKNVQQPVQIYAVQGEGLPEPSLKRFNALANPKKKFAIIPTVIVFLGIIVSSFLLVSYFSGRAEVANAELKLKDIQSLVDVSWRDYSEAYYLSKEIQKVIPDNHQLQELIEESSVKVNISTYPSGANVFVKLYNQPDSEWQELGVTPLDSVELPVGAMRWKFEKEGYETVLAADLTFRLTKDLTRIRRSEMTGNNIHRVLDHKDSIPDGMVRVAGATKPYGKIEDFFIDKYEITNQQFKVFIDQGGYEDPKYWQQLINTVDAPTDFEKAMKQFVDKTGFHGPSTWVNQNYPNGNDQYPVSGISWYEANAYAEFVEKSLPTKDHWGLARGEASNITSYQLGGNGIFAPFSNFHGQRSEPVGSLPGITSFGAFDMAGNVREWCWNESPNGRWMRGGSWNDNPYMFSNASQSHPLDRSDRNGFRCVSYINPDSIPKVVFNWVEEQGKYHRVPLPEAISNEQFESYKMFYEYDPSVLNAKVLWRKENEKGWILEKVAFDAAYDEERVYAFIFLPTKAKSPFQTIIYGPGSAVVWQESSEDFEDYFEYPAFLEFIVRSGRAVIFPIFKGSFERKEVSLSILHTGNSTHEYTSFIAKIVKDYRRCLDYMETREDLDMGKIAFYGMSWGPMLGSYLTAVESRISLNVFYAGGLKVFGRPEANLAHFVPRITIPTLMINGRYDPTFKVDYDVVNMYNLLGTPKNSKKLALFDSDHLAPKEDLVRETLAWLDQYFGQVLYIGNLQKL